MVPLLPGKNYIKNMNSILKGNSEKLDRSKNRFGAELTNLL